MKVANKITDRVRQGTIQEHTIKKYIDALAGRTLKKDDEEEEEEMDVDE